MKGLFQTIFLNIFGSLQGKHYRLKECRKYRPQSEICSISQLTMLRHSIRSSILSFSQTVTNFMERSLTCMNRRQITDSILGQFLLATTQNKHRPLVAYLSRAEPLLILVLTLKNYVQIKKNILIHFGRQLGILVKDFLFPQSLTFTFIFIYKANVCVADTTPECSWSANRLLGVVGHWPLAAN